MKSPIPPSVSERESAISRLAVPTTRVLAATIILITGTGAAAVFWKMPKASELHSLCHEGVIDKELAAVPLPSDMVAALSSEEMGLFSLPTLETAPVLADGAAQYGQVYQAPAPLAKAHAGQVEVEAVSESSSVPIAPQKFVPMRDVIEEKPISVEPVSRDFAPMPTSVSTTERSDELMAQFHFVENARAERNSPQGLLEDPFPRIETPSMPVVATLQPLPFQLDGLSPLIPVREIDLQPLVVQ